MTVKILLLGLLVKTVLLPALVTAQNEPDTGRSSGKIKSSYGESGNVKTTGNAIPSFSKTWTATFQDILATMNDQDRKELEAKMKRERFKLDMSDITYDIYQDIKTGVTFAIPSGEILQFSDGGWFNSGYSREPGMDTLKYSILFASTASFKESLNTVYSILENMFPRKLWKETGSKIDTSDHAQTSVSFRYADKINKFGELDALVSDSDLLLVTMTYNGYLVDKDAAYLKKFYQYSIAMYMASFTKY